MADGRTHARGTAIIGAALTAASLAGVALVHPACIGLAVGALVGHLVTPDLDLHDKVTYCERRMYRINQALGWCWHKFWLPYGRRNGHRGRSHTWRGTWDRFLRLLFIPIVASVWLLWSSVGLTGGALAVFWVLVFYGQFIQDMTHLALDGMLFGRRRR